MKKYKCLVCGYIYDPAEGDPASGIEPGIPFPDLPEADKFLHTQYREGWSL